MKDFSRFTIALIPLVVGFGACTADDPVPGEKSAASSETSEIEQIPSELSSQSLNLEDQNSKVEGAFRDAEHEPRACRVKLLYCTDPRKSYRGLATYCSNGCGWGEAYSKARSYCNAVCGNIDCDAALWDVGGC